MWRKWLLGALCGLAGLGLAAPAQAEVAPQPFRFNDGGGFNSILPPGTNGLANAAQIGDFLVNGNRPAHSDDQLRMYADLVYAVPGLRASDLRRYFKDSSFGIPPGEIDDARTFSPRPDATIYRDRQFGVPKIYASTRAGAMHAAGYVAAQDRLFFMDALRNAGRAQLAAFAGGSPGNRELDIDQWANAPYTEADLQRQYDLGDDVYGAVGRQLQEDITNYTAGVNAYINEAKLNPTKMPGEYAAIGRAEGPEPWRVTDSIAAAALIGGIFGKGGGEDLDWGLLLQDFQTRFGSAAGERLFRQFLAEDDPEAPTTVHGRRFPYGTKPRRPARGAQALPDRGSVTPVPVVESGEDAGTRAATRVASQARARGGLLGGFPGGGSNAVLLSARESSSGRPLAVFGPQVAYFNPQILLEQEIHAPGIDVAGAAFPGISLYVLLGRGRDYAWSATSAGNDIQDVFAPELCEPGGAPPTRNSMHYMFRGQCTPMEVLRRTNSWTPNAGDPTPAGSQTLKAERTKLGLVIARGTVNGRPVAYTRLRSTYFHEADSARTFVEMADPNRIRSARDFQNAFHKTGFTFNWFYVDSRDIAYFNSGNNPARPTGVDPQLPISSRFEWRNWNPDLWMARYTPFEQRPQTINQSFITSWNNKQARGFAGTPTNVFMATYRSELLDDEVIPRIAGRRKMSLVQLIEAMEDAGTVDLRARKVLPVLVKVLGSEPDPDLGGAIQRLKDWWRAGAHRRDGNRDGRYEHSEAIAIMDAWWPRLLEAQFKPVLGDQLFAALKSRVEFDNHPNNHGDHLGSAWQTGWYGYSLKDLRQVLRRKVRGRFSRTFCGAGDPARCREALRSSLRAALAAWRAPGGIYQDALCSRQGKAGDQWCYDAVHFRPTGAITQPLIHWINRPTWQQAVEVQGRAPR